MLVAHLRTQQFKPLAGFAPTIPAGERPQNNALDRAVTVIGHVMELIQIIMCKTCTAVYSEDKLEVTDVVKSEEKPTRCNN